jgi:hypothetical protein
MFEDLQEIHRCALECEARADDSSLSTSERQHQLSMAQTWRRIAADNEAMSRFLNTINGTAAEPERGAA